jgi:RNA polymerase sigma-70 factor, ECF subfamily
MTRDPQARPQREPGEIDELTLRRAQRGEPAACGALIERYQVPVHALLYRMLQPAGMESLVEDLAQETFLRVLAALPRFSPEGPARLSTWILTIAARLAISEARGPARRERPLRRMQAGEGDEGYGAARPDDEAQRRSVEATVRRAIAGLSPDHRAVLLLREYHDLDYPEIAQALQIDLGTVKSRLSRARAALREALSEMHHE